ncbi:MAG: NAD(P)-dependent dehydrogenase (short-subunit alcohol dehydrogenase family) [Candidatus Aldehydirespiratoraceae bacterium]|jgi:NAD(P)-dependent dehydrogenase (short-subunit alcohol dehydrogenase family)
MIRFRADDVTGQSGRTFLVTGANTGLGFETAKVLAARGARVLLGCRSQDKAEAAMAKISAMTPDADLAFIPLDQNDLASVAAAAEIVGDEDRLDVLVNNAGIMMPPLQFTVDGFESQFGVNHLATFALTSHLLPKLAKTPGSRVVVTSSIAHKPGEILFDDIDASSKYSAQERYQQSKLANLLFMYELDRRLQDAGSETVSVGCHPGIASTDLGRHMPRLLTMAMPAVGLLFNSPAQGAWPTLMAATSDDVEGGNYVGPTRRGETSGPAGPAASSSRARDPELASRLWHLSVEMTGVDPGI